jgi:uncharacterized membrane protein
LDWEADEMYGFARDVGCVLFGIAAVATTRSYWKFVEHMSMVGSGAWGALSGPFTRSPL